MGLYNETRDIDMLRTCILLPQSIYTEGLRETLTSLTGVGIYGNIPIEYAGILLYHIQWGYADIPNDGGVAAEVNAGGTVEVQNFDLPYGYQGELQWQTPIDGLRFTSMAQFTKIDSQVITNSTSPFGPGVPIDISLDNIQTYTVSGEYLIGNLTLNAEYFIRRADVFSTTPIMPVPVEDYKYQVQGYYGGTSYRFNDWFELGSYYSVFEGEYGDFTRDIALSTRFDLCDNWVFKLETHHYDGSSLVHSIDNPSGIDKNNWWLFAAKMTFSF